MHSRREFLRHLGGAAALAAIAECVPRAAPRPQPAAIRLGYASITWGGDDDRAIDDISALGFHGIQLRVSAVERWRADPSALRARLAARRLTFVALSSGDVPVDAATERRTIALHVEHARFVRDAGGLYLQLIDQRPRDRAVDDADYDRLGAILSEIGRRAADLGVVAAYHHHMGTLGEHPEMIERILAASDARYVKLLLDVAHYQGGGGDPVAAIRRHADRLLFLHIKDLQRGPNDSFRFVELGRGMVDLPGVFAALRDVRFRGWAIVELDSVPLGGTSPRDSAEISRRYLAERIGLSP